MNTPRRTVPEETSEDLAFYPIRTALRGDDERAAAMLERFTPAEVWKYALERWDEGEPDTIDRLLRMGFPMPRDAGAALADIISGKRSRKRGRKGPTRAKKLLLEVRNFVILSSFNQHREAATAAAGESDETPTARALAACALEYGIPVDEVSRIVFPRKGGR